MVKYSNIAVPRAAILLASTTDHRLVAPPKADWLTIENEHSAHAKQDQAPES